MQLNAVTKARTLAFIELDELNLHGKLRMFDVVRPLVEKYDFKSYPSKLEDFDPEEKGVSFRSGRIGDVVIDELKIFSHLLYVESLSSTEDSQKVILDMLTWGKEDLGFTYDKKSVRQWAYVSHLVFSTEFPILRSLSSPLESLAKKVSAHVGDIFKEPIEYDSINMSLGHDPQTRKLNLAPFSIQRRANASFQENKYFSEAPLPTELHKKMLEELEAEVLAGK